MHRKIYLIAGAVLITALFLLLYIPWHVGTQYGVNVNDLNHTEANYAQEAHLSWIRLQYDPASQSWSDALQYNFHILGIIDYVSVPQGFTYEQWNLTVRNAVLEYPQVNAWEIWNEPQFSAYAGEYLTPQQYFILLKYAYQNIKDVMPKDTVIGLGGWDYITPVQIQWLENLSKLNPWHYMDAVSVHLYSYASMNYTIPSVLAYFQSVISLVHTMTLKPIWVTETGAEQNQASYINNVYPFLVKSGITHIFWYDLAGQGWGILDQNDQPTAGYYALKAVT